MKRPMVALLIAPIATMREAIIAGRKTITIREGHRDYQVGDRVMLCCHLKIWAVMAEVTEVRHTIVRNVTEQEYNDSGYHHLAEMLADLKRFYPQLTIDSPVTVVRWANISGELVERHKNALALYETFDAESFRTNQKGQLADDEE